MDENMISTNTEAEVETPFRGGIHNIEIVEVGMESTVHDNLYMAVVESEIIYDLPVDAPIYPQVYLYKPDETDIANSGAANR